jgi:hypothetical protein
MFFRTKTSGTRSYLPIVENRGEDGRPKQRVIATLGRLDQLQQTGLGPCGGGPAITFVLQGGPLESP